MTQEKIYLIIRSLQKWDFLPIRILLRISLQRRTVTQLMSDEGHTQSEISQTLMVLRKWGLVSAIKDGKYRYYQPNMERKTRLLLFIYKMALLKIEVGDFRTFRDATRKTFLIMNAIYKKTYPDDLRTRLFEYIKDNPGVTNSEIEVAMGVNQSTVSRHLKTLTDTNWVVYEMEAKTRKNTANYPLIEQRQKWMDQFIKEYEG